MESMVKNFSPLSTYIAGYILPFIHSSLECTFGSIHTNKMGKICTMHQFFEELGAKVGTRDNPGEMMGFWGKAVSSGRKNIYICAINIHSR